MHYVICHMADGRWFASRPGCYLLHVSSSAILLCVSCQTVGILRLWYVAACI